MNKMTTQTKNILKMAGVLFIGLLLGWLFFGGNEKPQSNHDTDKVNEVIWTCSMHPQIRMHESGKCPICGMDLIPLDSNQSEVDVNAIQMTEDAIKLANIQTMVVGNDKANKELRLNGKVQIDERKVYTQSAHIPGRIESLKINFTGEKVNKGQVLAMVYSPELVTAQEELLQAFSINESQPELFEAAKQKLNNWKIGENSINKILSSGKIIQQFPITADVSGIVTAKKVELGNYVGMGVPIYEITDLSSLWILFDVYESDMPWVKVGDKISYTIQSIPGETFEGKISFLDPFINPQTRVATARIEIKNIENNLKPEMFVSGIIKNNVSKSTFNEIVIPKSAVMWTGERSVIYIQIIEENGVSFKLREVTLGPSLGDSYVIKSGLETGEEIVVNGTFTVDAASQLAGKPSMMNLEGGKKMAEHENMDMSGTKTENGKKPASIINNESKNKVDYSTMDQRIVTSKEFQSQLKIVFMDYNQMKDALVKDDFKTSNLAALSLLKNIDKINMKLLVSTDAHKQWMALEPNIKLGATKISNSKTIEEERKYFIQLSMNMMRAVKIFGVNLKIYEQFCPMANENGGAYWLSMSKEILNPYFGEAMLTCGSTKQIIE